jgi:hypothetical protein
VKLCPGCNLKKERDEFYEEPTDTITGLSALCRECIAKRKARPKKRRITGWHTISPAGLPGEVLNIREDTEEIVIRFKGSRTVVLPMEEK